MFFSTAKPERVKYLYIKDATEDNFTAVWEAPDDDCVVEFRYRWTGSNLANKTSEDSVLILAENFTEGKLDVRTATTFGDGPISRIDYRTLFLLMCCSGLKFRDYIQIELKERPNFLSS